MSDEKEIARLRGVLRYIAVQAKEAQPGALEVIRQNAEAALADEYREIKSAVAEIMLAARKEK